MLAFDFDARQIAEIAKEFDATDKQISQAYSRALRRTASALKTKAGKELRVRLGLRTAAVIRRRLAGFSFKKDGALGSVRMWFGMNDIPVSGFKGRPVLVAGGAALGNRNFPGAFIGKNSKGVKTIMRRVGAARFPIVEQSVPIGDEMQVFVEDEVFADIDDIFFRNFRAEIRARTIYGVGE
jgi:hypothetical protein